MNDTPTSGPMSTSITHQERDAISSRHSLARSQRHGDLGERKKHLLEIGGMAPDAPGGYGRQLVVRAFAGDPAVAEEHEPIADPGGIADLMDRQNYRAAAG